MICLALATLVRLTGCADGKVAVNGACTSDDDCADGICHQGICMARQPGGEGSPCAGVGECKSFTCGAGKCIGGEQADGTPCRYQEQCLSRQCVDGTCGGEGSADAGTDGQGSPETGPAQDAGPAPDAGSAPETGPAPDTGSKPDVLATPICTSFTVSFETAQAPSPGGGSTVTLSTMAKNTKIATITTVTVAWKAHSHALPASEVLEDDFRLVFGFPGAAFRNVELAYNGAGGKKVFFRAPDAVVASSSFNPVAYYWIPAPTECRTDAAPQLPPKASKVVLVSPQRSLRIAPPTGTTAYLWAKHTGSCQDHYAKQLIDGTTWMNLIRDQDNGVPLYTKPLELHHSPDSTPKVLQDFKLGDKPATLWLISKKGPAHVSSNPYAFECYCPVELYLEYR